MNGILSKISQTKENRDNVFSNLQNLDPKTHTQTNKINNEKI